MLPVFKTVLLPAFVLPSASRDLAALAAGFVVDLALLMNRLGDVRAVPLIADPALSEPSVGPRLHVWEAPALDRMMDVGCADAVVTGHLAMLPDGLFVRVELLRRDGASLWTDQLEFTDGLVCDARLVLAANLIEAVTSQRKDVRQARVGGTQAVEAFKRVCLARYAGLPAAKRLEVLEQAIVIDPDFAEAQLLLADVLESAGQRERACNLLAAVARRFPGFAWARQRYGVALRVAGYADEAVAEVQAALDSEPDGMTLFHAGLFAEAGRDPTTARTLYRRAVDRGCIDPVLCDKLARLEANAGQPLEAIELWERARLLDPGFDHVLGNLALAHHHAGDCDDAAALFSMALERAPQTFTTHANRAVYLQDLGRHVEALEACSKALVIRPNSPLMYNNRGVSRLALGDRSGARRDFEAALDREPGAELQTYIRANLARLAQGDARADEAGRLLARGARLVREEQAREAIPLLLEALDLVPSCWEAEIFLALAYRQDLDWDQAAAALQRVLYLQENSAAVRGEYALTLLALGRREEALAEAQRAATESNVDPGLVCNLGLVQLETGRFDEAQESFDAAARLDPSDPVIERCLKELKRRRRKNPDWGSGDWAL